MITSIYRQKNWSILFAVADILKVFAIVDLILYFCKIAFVKQVYICFMHNSCFCVFIVVCDSNIPFAYIMVSLWEHNGNIIPLWLFLCSDYNCTKNAKKSKQCVEYWWRQFVVKTRSILFVLFCDFTFAILATMWGSIAPV